jgi:3-isopropylmalate/(R)-2-methylmalate dehydratase small subunit
MPQFTTLTARAIALRVNDIDTDQIIPARFLKATDKAGMGDHLFADWRYNADGSPKPDFALNQPDAQGAQILLAGDNFGCGSSREHAPWALAGFGFRAVVSTSFADIFRNNALKNGLLPVAVDREMYGVLCDLLARHPDAQLSIDLAAQSLTLPDGRSVTFSIDGFAKTCLLNGVDELGYLLGFADKIAEYEAGVRNRGLA